MLPPDAAALLRKLRTPMHARKVDCVNEKRQSKTLALVVMLAVVAMVVMVFVVFVMFVVVWWLWW